MPWISAVYSAADFSAENIHHVNIALGLIVILLYEYGQYMVILNKYTMLELDYPKCYMIFIIY